MANPSLLTNDKEVVFLSFGLRHSYDIRHPLTKQLPQGVSRLFRPHEGLANEKRIDTPTLQEFELFTCRETTFADEKRAIGPFREKIPRRIQTYFESLQVAIVDANDRWGETRGAPQSRRTSAGRRTGCARGS